MAEAEPETITTTIEVNKDIFLKFKALCVLREVTISSMIEKMIKRWIEEQPVEITREER